MSLSSCPELFQVLFQQDVRFEHQTVLNDQVDLLGIGNVLQRISVKNDQVCVFARFDGAQLVFFTENLGVVQGRGQQRRHRR